MLESETDKKKPAAAGEALSPEKVDHPAGDTLSTVDFKPWHEEPLPEETRGVISHQTIIKKEQIKEGRRKVIKAEVPLEPDDEALVVVPIVEDEEIVGLRISCRCGAEHEIRFEYD